jgi:hypothetical protein
MVEARRTRVTSFRPDRTRLGGMVKLGKRLKQIAKNASTGISFFDCQPTDNIRLSASKCNRPVGWVASSILGDRKLLLLRRCQSPQ